MSKTLTGGKATPAKKKPLATKLLAKKKVVKSPAKKITTRSRLQLPPELLLHMHDLMVKSRALEERLIKIYKRGDAYFWIGGPGEEAFGVPLGLLTHKGQGVDYDYLHLHYRATPTLLALGMSMLDAIRLIMNRATDPCTGGRNFANHYCFPQWNVVPVSSPIEVQYGMAVGTGIVQARQKNNKAISIITGGDAGTAEGDFATCLVWASRPALPLPLLITVQNNKVGISTEFKDQHGEKYIADRGKAFGMRTAVVNGNDPIETYLALQAEMEYIRKNRKPVLMEFMVSRLYGHSSATGANREAGEDCIETFEKKLVDSKVLKGSDAKAIWAKYDAEALAAAEQAASEPAPSPDSIWDHTYANGENADWRKF